MADKTLLDVSTEEYLHPDMKDGTFTMEVNKDYTHPDWGTVTLVGVLRGIATDVDLAFGYDDTQEPFQTLSTTDTDVGGTTKTFEIDENCSFKSPLVVLKDGTGELFLQDMLTFYDNVVATA